MDYFIPAVVSTILLVVAVGFLVKVFLEKKRNDEYYKECLKEKDQYRRELVTKYDTKIMKLREEYREKIAIVRVGDKETYPHPTDSDLSFVEKELTRKGFDPDKVLVVPWYLTFDTIQSLASARKNKDAT